MAVVIVPLDMGQLLVLVMVVIARQILHVVQMVVEMDVMDTKPDVHLLVIVNLHRHALLMGVEMVVQVIKQDVIQHAIVRE